ncbi:hypothetical protein NIES593_19230 [Hydrococcus rivularis NIES-593]|uniref:Glycosyltransferase 2-like domain-containing protein n=1 Tax=Hydrococcus rivularis NIES-593 TaxID=1921803 RepID=A0A1U7H9T2_9CYAN|nr:glycosyltransferase family A protein [Hydrococcus rivularis]OKH20357.1 hypothetical protein NIES593_19230 [Hydrococcus rivularis NIES-593]
MLVFIIPLKSPQVSKSWENVCSIFERTLRSVCNQTSSNFKVIVVCNQKPDITYNHPKVIYLVDTFPIPKPEVGFSKELDRTRKMLAGIIYAKKLEGTTHIMLVDADDCVSNRLADYVETHPNEPGWLVTSGYWYRESSNFVKVMRKAFYEYCGTSNILRADIYDVDTYNEENVNKLFKYYRHKIIKKNLENKRVHLAPLPFKGVVYIVHHGENTYYAVGNKHHKISLKSRFLRWKTLLDNRFLTPKIKEEFSLI